MTGNVNDASKASQVFRIFSYALQGKPETARETYAEQANEKAQDKKNESGMSIMLDDYKRTYTSLGDDIRSNIRLEDCIYDVNAGFIDRMQRRSALKNNIFANTETIEDIAKNGKVYQADLFESELYLSDGIRYAKEGDDLAKSALNFAESDIKLVEHVYVDALAWDDTENYLTGEKNKKLNIGEILSYADIDQDSINSDYIKDIDISTMFWDDEDITAKEYASYILYADKNKDGVINKEEAQAIADAKDENLQEEVKKEYWENYSWFLKFIP